MLSGLGVHIVERVIEETQKIANQVEQEYNNDFCEWKFEETTGIVWHCDDKCTTYNLSYATNLRNIADDFECKCPYCGKKIKVVSNE